MRWLALLLLLWATPAFSQCLPVPNSFPLTPTAVSTHFAKLYGCINGGAVVPPGTATFTAITTTTALVRGTLTLMSLLIFPGGVFLEEHNGVLYIHTTGSHAPTFGQTNLGITTMSKQGSGVQRVLVGPENSGGLGYRMLRVPNWPGVE